MTGRRSERVSVRKQSGGRGLRGGRGGGRGGGNGRGRGRNNGRGSKGMISIY